MTRDAEGRKEVDVTLKINYNKKSESLETEN